MQIAASSTRLHYEHAPPSFKDPINRIILPGDSPLILYKIIILLIFDPHWMYQTLGDMLRSIVSNSDFWKRLGARDMTICGSHVGPHILNI